MNELEHELGDVQLEKWSQRPTSPLTVVDVTVCDQDRGPASRHTEVKDLRQAEDGLRHLNHYNLWIARCRVHPNTQCGIRKSIAPALLDLIENSLSGVQQLALSLLVDLLVCHQQAAILGDMAIGRVDVAVNLITELRGQVEKGLHTEDFGVQSEFLG